MTVRVPFSVFSMEKVGQKEIAYLLLRIPHGHENGLQGMLAKLARTDVFLCRPQVCLGLMKGPHSVPCCCCRELGFQMAFGH